MSASSLDMIRRALRSILMEGSGATAKEKLEAAKMLQGLLVKDGRAKNDARKNLGQHAVRRDSSAPPKAHDLLGASK